MQNKYLKKTKPIEKILFFFNFKDKQKIAENKLGTGSLV